MFRILTQHITHPSTSTHTSYNRVHTSYRKQNRKSNSIQKKSFQILSQFVKNEFTMKDDDLDTWNLLTDGDRPSRREGEAISFHKRQVSNEVIEKVDEKKQLQNRIIDEFFLRYNGKVDRQLIKVQLDLEEEAHARMFEDFHRSVDNVFRIGKGASTKIVGKIEKKYFDLLMDIYKDVVVKKEEDEEEELGVKGLIKTPEEMFFQPLGKKKTFIIIIQCIFNTLLKKKECSLRYLVEHIHRTLVDNALLDSFGQDMKEFYKRNYGNNYSNLKSFSKKNGVPNRFEHIPDNVIEELTYDIIMDIALTDISGKDKDLRNLLTYEIKEGIPTIVISQRLINEIRSKSSENLIPYIKHFPMVIPPLPWTGPLEGGYLKYKIPIIRAYSFDKQITPMKTRSDYLQSIYEALNVLGGTAWKVNQFVLDVMEEVIIEENGGLGELPSLVDMPLPLVGPEGMTKEWHKETKRIHRTNYNLNSLRCDLELKMEVARFFKGYKEVYFPHNLDFRGRVYPIPPHLNHMGADIARGLLVFSEGKKLGKRGLWWLKVQVSNVMGNDKVTLEERVKYTEDNMDKVYESVYHPLNGSRWWLEADDPWQCLGTCHEIVRAIESGDPENFISHIPLRQDGTCNGLQHYAALGGDISGALSVNVLPSPSPRDVYSDVLALVRMRVETDAANGVEIAIKLKDRLHRKIIKQTVMTNVYGVTFVGARKQIANALRDKYPEMDDEDVLAGSKYLAHKTFDSIREMFNGAKNIMDWLTVSANIISKAKQRVNWITPLGLPVTQPYAKHKKLIKTTVGENFKENDGELPIDSRKQTSAFPPNFVHSLDSTHMMLTALACNGAGLHFASVHDSYWTHASDTDIMNRILRQQFVNLYKRPVLDQLKLFWEEEYPDLEIPDLPERGYFDLNKVKESVFFFS
eukprot:TRINITY_DN5418_c0_g1_i1.p1 TRINITY_DN5418_c0_g1~~TRINITY_DN5418_c0_g1_i1.p1  ORF type:complete len:915 (-),score=191.24 TRINITY_DN5418_c0_g1_i1:1274-4018(-)